MSRWRWAPARREVDVTATAAMVDDTKSDVSTVVDNRQISELPINGRRVDSFVLLTPGVTNDATFGLLSFRGVAGNNSFLLDGNDNTEQFYDENAGRTRIQSQISQDAVQEFQVVSSDYSAEYGRAMGGVVNTVTKSGSNDYHGSGFYYFRSTGFDARDSFAAFNPSEKRVEGGATVGGKIIKDKLFFFLNFDLHASQFSDGGQLRFGHGAEPHDPEFHRVRLPPLRPRSAAPSMACCRASTARFRAPTITTWVSAGSTIISPIRTPSRRSSISCAGCRRTAFRPASAPLRARPSTATATIPSACATESSDGLSFPPAIS